MSQIQIRQIPVAKSTDAQRVIGSWFPSGYYGHFRAKSRADLSSYFRQLARPVPPKKFCERQNAEATQHMFSRHDNRFKFECDPLVRGTQEGFGKRKSETNTRGEFDPLFVSWVPKNVDRKAFVEAIKSTSYADDYNKESTPSQAWAEIQAKQTTNIDPPTVPPPLGKSVYTTVYNHGQPDSEQSKQTQRETFQRFLSTRTRRLHQRGEKATSVAACMIWNNGNNDVGTVAPTETLISICVPVTLQPRTITNHSHTPHPPTSPRQRAQSAGPRLSATTATNHPPPPSLPPQQIFQSHSMQMFKTTTATDRPHTATTTSREHFTGANFGVKVAPIQRDLPPPRATTSFEQTHTNSMDSLISKYL